MIAGGYVREGVDEFTEVVELVKTNSTPFFGQLPTLREGAVGAIFGNSPILCGGSFLEYEDCISFQNLQWNKSHSLIRSRNEAAGVQINSTTFWILGGNILFEDSTEFIIQGQTTGVPGPKLPYGLNEMCAVKLSAQEIFVIGGFGYGEGRFNEVWIFNPQNGFARTQGPSLNTARAKHSCSTMKDGEKTLIVVAGGRDENNDGLDSVEIYDPTHETWYSGKTNSQPQKTFLI